MDFSKLPPAATGPELPEALRPGKGKLPLKRGAVFLSEETKKELRQFGWKDGDPVPPDLGKHIAAARAALAAEQNAATQQLLEADPGKTTREQLARIKREGFTPSSQLSPEKQKEIARYVQQYKEDTLREEALETARAENPGPDLSRMDPSVAQAYLAAIAAKEGGPAQNQAAPMPGVELPPGKVLAGALGEPSAAVKVAEVQRAAAAWQAQQESQEAQATPPPADDDKPVSAGADSPLLCCAWCGRDPHGTPVPLTADDKIEFFALFLGEKRFRKEVSLMSGKLKIRFRSLTLGENQIIDRQLGVDVAQRRIMGDSDWLAALTNYRFAAALERFSLAGQISKEVPPLETAHTKFLPAGDGPDTGLPGYLQWVCDNIIVHEPVRRVLSLAHRDFQRLVEHLEVAVFDANFLEGIELPGSWLGQPSKA